MKVDAQTDTQTPGQPDFLMPSVLIVSEGIKSLNTEINILAGFSNYSLIVSLCKSVKRLGQLASSKPTLSRCY